MKEYYEMTVAGVTRQLPLFAVTPDLKIAAFVIFGDVEMTVKAAEELIKIAPEHDVMITSEAKSIPLIHEMARQMDVNKYVIARKGVKVYMADPYSVEVNSITTAKKQKLFIGKSDMDYLKGKRVLIVDDVISTGESLKAIEKLVIESGGTIAGKMAILAEGDAKYRDDIYYLDYLPLFDKEGEVLSGTPVKES
jgi:adenine phosphoribosyltransferase